MRGNVLKSYPRDESSFYGIASFLDAWQEDAVCALHSAWDIERHRDKYPGSGLALLVKNGYLSLGDVQQACLAYLKEWIAGNTPRTYPAIDMLAIRDVLAWLGYKENACVPEVRDYTLSVATEVLQKIRACPKNEHGHLFHAFLTLLMNVGAPYPRALQELVGEFDGRVILVARDCALFIRFAETAPL